MFLLPAAPRGEAFDITPLRELAIDPVLALESAGDIALVLLLFEDDEELLLLSPPPSSSSPSSECNVDGPKHTKYFGMPSFLLATTEMTHEHGKRVPSLRTHFFTDLHNVYFFESMPRMHANIFGKSCLCVSANMFDSRSSSRA